MSKPEDSLSRNIDAMARELSRNPDSPASLRILSGINAALKPSRDTAEQLMEAMAQQMEHPGPESDAAFQAAKVHWETTCNGQLTPDLEEEMRSDVAATIRKPRKGPPAIEEILPEVRGRSDVGYDKGMHMHGIRGIWHRLWAIIASGVVLGEDAAHRAAVAEIRQQFESQLGRSLSQIEWQQLEEHGRAHGASMAQHIG